ncbi:MAG: RNB domain-containing ribonuclease [Syntrophales bacterium]
MSLTDYGHRSILRAIARRAMIDKGLLPDFSHEAIAELAGIKMPAITDVENVRDLRNILWASIDNDDTLDIDQLTAAQAMPGDAVKILVAVADVDAIVRNGSAIDDHARRNTTSVYTAAETFPMLPEKLSTDLTSLSFSEDRLAIVVEVVIDRDGSLLASDIYRAHVCNRAKLAYNSVAAWLEGIGNAPEALHSVNGLDENLRMQDSTAQIMKNYRRRQGALSLETVEARPVFLGDQIRDLEVEKKNRARTIIEEFMIAANIVAARYLSSKKSPSLRRAVRTPKRWERIVEIAREHGFELPQKPDPVTLEEFLVKEKGTDPQRFPDLSLSIIKLIGPGEYIADTPGDTDAPGHFGLAAAAYTHSTAPNRRYVDLVMQRLLKAAVGGTPVPYSSDELQGLAIDCTEKEHVADKVERQVFKSAAAILLESRIGEEFNAIVTGASPKGTWVRLAHPPVEGKLVDGFHGLDIGHRIRVQLIHTDVESGFIDFKKVR